MGPRDTSLAAAPSPAGSVRFGGRGETVCGSVSQKKDERQVVLVGWLCWQAGTHRLIGKQMDRLTGKYINSYIDRHRNR